MVLQNTKPLYLKLAYNEARRWYSYDPAPKLNKSVQGLISDLISRLSSSEQHGELLVSRTLGFLAQQPKTDLPRTNLSTSYPTIRKSISGS